MQQEVFAERPDLDIEILAINQVGLDGTAAALGDGRYTIALLQDSLDVNAWGLWQVNYRDFFIIDAEGLLVSITQLSPPDEGGGGIINDSEAYGLLKEALIAVGSGE
jgi:hypothetical protein